MSDEEPHALKLGEPLKEKPTEPTAVAVSRKTKTRKRWSDEGLDRPGVTIISEASDRSE